jgi:hypothetical protein
MTDPKPLPKRALHIVRSRASSFKWEYPLLSLKSSNNFLRLLPCLPVTSIPPCIFPSVTRCRRQFRRKMWPFQFAFRLRISCRIFLCSLTLSNTSSFLTWSVQLIFSILLKLTVSNSSFLYYQWQCFCICRFRQLYFRNQSELDTRSYFFFSHHDRYCHLPDYWPFLLNHPVFHTWRLLG